MRKTLLEEICIDFRVVLKLTLKQFLARRGMYQ